ncbi:MAG: hypothetical protein JSR66_04940 [Proteobacteria bacterium]|nr:hypothetical protein [Pseudomonadota bacterium]
MTKSEMQEQIQRALREKRQGTTYGYTSYLYPTVETQATTYFFPQSSSIVVASETSSLSKLVAETREQMRNEQRAAKVTLNDSGGNFYVGDWSLPTVSGTFYRQLSTDQPTGLSEVDSGVRDQLPLLKQTEPPMANASSAPAPGNVPLPLPPEAVVVQRAPAAQLHHLAKRILEPEVYQRYVEPHLADMWLQYNEALRRRDDREARRVVLRGYFEVLKPLLYGALRMLFRWWMRVGS